MQSPATNTIEAILCLYDYISLFLVIIFIFVSYAFFDILEASYDDANTDEQPSKCDDEFAHNTTTKISRNGDLEVIWTIIPVLILTAVAYPSFELLYALDMCSEPDLIIKVIGNQWYWSYETIAESYQTKTGAFSRLFEFEKNHSMPLTNEISCDSYMLDGDELELGTYRLLEPDLFLELPTGVKIQFNITSTDVLHSFSMPQLGIKLDAVPGRLNRVNIIVTIPGIYFGQCSELCGVGHGFMPIKIQFTKSIEIE